MEFRRGHQYQWGTGHRRHAGHLRSRRRLLRQLLDGSAAQLARLSGIQAVSERRWPGARLWRLLVSGSQRGPDQVSCFAALDTPTGDLTLLLINKNPQATATVPISLKGFQAASGAPRILLPDGQIPRGDHGAGRAGPPEWGHDILPAPVLDHSGASGRREGAPVSDSERPALPAWPTVRELEADLPAGAPPRSLCGRCLLGLTTGVCLVVSCLSAPAVVCVRCPSGGASDCYLAQPQAGRFLIVGGRSGHRRRYQDHFPRLGGTVAPSSFFFLPPVPFFRPVQEIVKGFGLFLTVAELCMFFVALICVLQAVYRRRFRFEKGTFFPAFVALFAWWIIEAVQRSGNGAPRR